MCALVPSGGHLIEGNDLRQKLFVEDGRQSLCRGLLPQVAKRPPGPPEVRDDRHLSQHRGGQGALQGQICAAQQPAGLPVRAPRLDSRGWVGLLLLLLLLWGEGLRFISAGNAELRFSGDGGRRLCFQGAVRARTRRRRRWCATAPSATWANVARAAL